MADHKDPCDLHNKPAAIEAQQAFDAAWADLEAYRKEVDADRRATATTADGGGRPQLRPWSEEESGKFAKRLAAARKASEDRAAAMASAGLTSTYEIETELRKHAREDAATAVE
jgi:hypothetical protein